MKMIIEGRELRQAIRRGLSFDVPNNATITITAGRGTNEDRAELEWSLEEDYPLPAETEEVLQDPPFEPDAEDPVVPEVEEEKPKTPAENPFD